MTIIDNQTKQEIKLIEGNFTAAEATDIINAVLEVKINFHKLQRLSKTAGNENDTCKFDNTRIDELIQSQKKAKLFLKNIRENGGEINISSTIKITSKH